MSLLLESSFHSRGRTADLRNGGWFGALWVKSFWQKETEGLKIWSDFFFYSLFWVSLDNPLHSNCLACHILAKAIRMNVGGEGRGGVCWLATIEVILSYVHVSLLLNAVFSKWEFLWSWNVKWSRKLKTQMSPFFFPCPPHPKLLLSHSYVPSNPTPATLSRWQVFTDLIHISVHTKSE